MRSLRARPPEAASNPHDPSPLPLSRMCDTEAEPEGARGCWRPEPKESRGARPMEPDKIVGPGAPPPPAPVPPPPPAAAAMLLRARSRCCRADWCRDTLPTCIPHPHLDHLLQLLRVRLVLRPLKGVSPHQNDKQHHPAAPDVSYLRARAQRGAAVRAVASARSPSPLREGCRLRTSSRAALHSRLLHSREG